MQWKSILFGAAVAAVAFVAAGRVFSGDAPEEQNPGNPGPEHAMLKTHEGTWEGKGVGNGLAVTATQNAKMIFGGRFLQIESDFTIALPSGPLRVKMLEFVGYDNHAKKFVHFSIEDDSTQVTHDEGQHDAAAKLSTMQGTETKAGGKVTKFRYTVSDVIDGAFEMEFFSDDGEGEAKVMEITFKKK